MQLPAAEQQSRPTWPTAPPPGPVAAAAVPISRSAAGATGIGARPPPSEPPSCAPAGAVADRPSGRSPGVNAVRWTVSEYPAASVEVTVTRSDTGAGVLPGDRLPEADGGALEREREHRLHVEVDRRALRRARCGRRRGARARDDGGLRVTRERRAGGEVGGARVGVGAAAPARSAAVVRVECRRGRGALVVGRGPVADEVDDAPADSFPADAPQASAVVPWTSATLPPDAARLVVPVASGVGSAAPTAAVEPSWTR